MFKVLKEELEKLGWQYFTGVKQVVESLQGIKVTCD